VTAAGAAVRKKSRPRARHNGRQRRWAKEARGCPRPRGTRWARPPRCRAVRTSCRGRHRVGVRISAYDFYTEKVEALAEEVRWLMGFNRDVIPRRRDQFVEMGVGTGPVAGGGQAVARVIPSWRSRRREPPQTTLSTLHSSASNYRRGRAELLRPRSPDGPGPSRRPAEMPTRSPRDRRESPLLPGIPEVDLRLRSSGELRWSKLLIGRRRSELSRWTRWGRLQTGVTCGTLRNCSPAGRRYACIPNRSTPTGGHPRDETSPPAQRAGRGGPPQAHREHPIQAARDVDWGRSRGHCR